MTSDQQDQIRALVEDYMPPPAAARQRFREVVQAAATEGLDADAAARRAGEVLKDDPELWEYFARLSEATSVVEAAITGGSATVFRPAWQPSDGVTWDELIAVVADRLDASTDTTA